MRSAVSFVFMGVFAWAWAAFAQEFEVVSVKPDKSLSNDSHTSSNQGRYTATNASLRNLIVEAYDFTLDWVPESESTGDGKGDPAFKQPAAVAAEPSGPTLTCARTKSIVSVAAQQGLLTTRRMEREETANGLLHRLILSHNRRVLSGWIKRKEIRQNSLLSAPRKHLDPHLGQ